MFTFRFHNKDETLLLFQKMPYLSQRSLIDCLRKKHESTSQRPQHEKKAVDLLQQQVSQNIECKL